jgi:hypothetical protein
MDLNSFAVFFLFRNNMGGSGKWDSQMMDSLKDFDLNSAEVKQQFGEFGIDCFCYMFHLPNVHDYDLRTWVYCLPSCYLSFISFL